MRIQHVWTTLAGLCLLSFGFLGNSAHAVWLVSSNGSDQILQYDNSGNFDKVFAEASIVDPSGHVLDDPNGLAIGPDGNIYASYSDGWHSDSGGVARFKQDGTFVDNFVTIHDAFDVDFGPDGHLYVSQPNDGVYRVKGPLHTGAGTVDTSFGSAGRIPVGTARGIEILDLGGGNFDIFATSKTQIERYAVTGGTVNLTAVDTYAIPSYAQGLEMGPDDRLYATSDSSHQVSVLDLPGGATAFTLFAASGSATPSLSTPIGLGFEADGNVLVNNLGRNTVARYSPAGAFLGNFVTAGSGGLSVPYMGLLKVDRPLGIGQLLVGNFADDNVTRFNAYTGAFIDTFVPAGSGGLNGTTGMDVGPDGNLYVASHLTHEIMRYDGQTGAFIDTFVSSGSGGLEHPERMMFLDDGTLLVASWYGTKGLLRYDSNGNAMAPFALFDYPRHMTVGPDYNGDGYDDLYATAVDDHVKVFSLKPEALSGSDPFGTELAQLCSGLSSPHHLLFIPDWTGDGVPELLVGEYHADRVTLLDIMDGATGTNLGTFGQMHSGSPAGLDNPIGLSIGLDGNLYVASRGDDRILKFDPDGLFLGVFINSHIDGPGTLLFAIPEPSTMGLFLIGSLGLFGAAVSRRRACHGRRKRLPAKPLTS